MRLLTLVVIVLITTYTARKAVDGYVTIRESNAKINSTINPRDYQIEITDSLTYIYDGERLVEIMEYDGNSEFDKIMTRDNQ